ncbi:BrnA antitoxin family protein [Agrobacterium rosae]|uniref:BrnA antitoxin family protein n=1 Tax=Agrobacterium rosae TaxID=1972867 RepID=UPI0019D3CFC6|nr:BrnA antitoxin family protein [Agrobacterium rosae]MBN7807061.1 BrnA antitoxin family protein [Agrobacterium rosae]
MAKTLKAKTFQAGRGYSEADWDAVDFPEIPEAELERARPAAEVLPAEFFKAMDEQRVSRGRPALENPKRQITLRLDEDVIARFRQSGKGWQGRMNEALRKAAGL